MALSGAGEAAGRSESARTDGRKARRRPPSRPRRCNFLASAILLHLEGRAGSGRGAPRIETEEAGDGRQVEGVGRVTAPGAPRDPGTRRDPPGPRGKPDPPVAAGDPRPDPRPQARRVDRLPEPLPSPFPRPRPERRPARAEPPVRGRHRRDPPAPGRLPPVRPDRLLRAEELRPLPARPGHPGDPRIRGHGPLPRVLRKLPAVRRQGEEAVTRGRALLAALLLALPLRAAGAAPSAPPRGVAVLASFLPMYVFTRNVVGDAPGVAVDLMLPADLGCPHDYALTPGDMKKIASAELFIANGLGMEEFLGAPVRKVNPGIRIVETAAAVPPVREDGGDRGGVNPHAWVSPKSAILQVREI